MAETRVVGPAARKIRPEGTDPAAGAAPVPGQEQASAPAPRRRRGLLVLAVLALLAVAAAAFLLLRPTAPEEPAAPEPGETVAVEPISINLAEGHYLRVGFSIQLTADAHEIEPAKATDVAISLFSGLTIEEVNDPVRRTELKAELTRQLTDAYEGEVMAVYFTDFVTQ